MLALGTNIPVRTRTIAMLVFAVLAVFSVPVPAAQAVGRYTALDGAERALLKEINRVRAANGQHRLTRNRRLQASADYHSSDMLRRDFFAHSSSNGTSFQARVKRYVNKKRLGENLAYMPTLARDNSARRIVQLWMNSAGHRAALLSPAFRRVGIARRIGKWGKQRVAVYTVDFASKR